MPMPKSVTKIKKDGVEFVSDVDRANYTIRELTRAALIDTAKFLRKRMLQQIRALKGMKKSKRPYNSTQFWVRKRESDLIIGFKHDSWYGAHSELGDRNQPRRGILRDTVMNNIDQIREIQGKYLSAIEDDVKARSLIDEGEARGDEDS